MTNITNLFNRMNYCIPIGIGSIPYHLTADGHSVFISKTTTIVYIFNITKLSAVTVDEIVTTHNENMLLGIDYIDYNNETKRLLNEHYIKLGLSDEEALNEFGLMGFSL